MNQSPNLKRLKDNLQSVTMFSPIGNNRAGDSASEMEIEYDHSYAYAKMTLTMRAQYNLVLKKFKVLSGCMLYKRPTEHINTAGTLILWTKLYPAIGADLRQALRVGNLTSLEPQSNFSFRALWTIPA